MKESDKLIFIRFNKLFLKIQNVNIFISTKEFYLIIRLLSKIGNSYSFNKY